jgi:hypothetical protein
LPQILKPKWPLQRDAKAFYGDPRQPNWLHENTVDVICPWILHIEDEAVNKILIHKKCAESLTRVLNSIWEACDKSQDKIENLHYDRYSGSYNFRPIRGSHSGILSMHSYACAIDWDAEENEQHSEKHLFQDNSLLVQEFKKEGWIWGGDWSPASIDAMHVQACRVH